VYQILIKEDVIHFWSFVFTSEGESDNSTDSFYFSDNNLINLLRAIGLFHHHSHSCILLHI